MEIYRYVINFFLFMTKYIFKQKVSIEFISITPKWVSYTIVNCSVETNIFVFAFSH
jgi:hypothetical protein